ncbi:MAG: hypothetical protein ABJ065_14690 [Marinobacter sp.]
MTGYEQSFGTSKMGFLRTVFEGLVSQVLEKLGDAVGAKIRHSKAFATGCVKQRQEGRKGAKTSSPVTRNRTYTKDFPPSFDALSDQLFDGALAGRRNVVISLTVKWPEISGSYASGILGKSDDGVCRF